MANTIFYGDNVKVLKQYPSNHFDSCVTDPPAGIGFMGHEWDNNKGGKSNWVDWLTGVLIEVKRVLKPGAFCAIWCLPKTSHWTASAIENSGLIVHDYIVHVFSKGTPKNYDVVKALKNKYPNAHKTHEKFAGFGTALKPRAEFWILAYKPSSLNYADNLYVHDVGALNIAGSRIGTEEITTQWVTGSLHFMQSGNSYMKGTTIKTKNIGRWPANILLDDGAARLLDRIGGSSKMFFCHKVERSRRFFIHKPTGKVYAPEHLKKFPKNEVYFHPTQKNVLLMEYITRLITPRYGRVLDPFMGSASTGEAASLLEMDFVGIDTDKKNCAIAAARLKYLFPKLSTKRLHLC
jgi:site-specific DNA-methyltransferase (adenine-specific)